MIIGISEFKSKSLKLLDNIQRSGEPITVTKRGAPIAKVIPLSGQSEEIDLKGSISYQDEDIFGTGEKWDADL